MIILEILETINITTTVLQGITTKFYYKNYRQIHTVIIKTLLVTKEYFAKKLC